MDLYNVTFLSDNGKKFVFGKDGNVMFDMDIGDGVSVDIGTSQGFAQVGESVQTQSVKGRNIKASGAIYGKNTYERKTAMRKIFAPFVSGRLVFGDKYYIRVFVKDTPSFSPVKTNGKFTMRFFAPFPFFRSANEISELIGGITPMFRFPINYSKPHQFGVKSDKRYTNILNDGDVKVPFSLYLESSGQSTNPVVTNLDTLEYLKINGTLQAGDIVNIFRDEDNVLRAVLTHNGQASDALSMIDDGSTLFELNVGDNQISATDDEGGAALTARFGYSPAVVSVYES